MTSVVFTHAFTVVGGFVVDVPDAAGPYTMTFAAPDLTVGETFTLTGAGGGTIPGATYHYLGVSATGEPFFDVVDAGVTVESFLSDTTHPTGSTPPSFTGSPFTCFLAGTRIATPMGEGVAVETLAVGDLVLTAGWSRVPVKWIGRQTLSTKFGVPEGRRPVSIAAGALGKDLPVRDLRVTAAHALLIDGVLVDAGALVNGTSIRRMEPAELGERFTVYHIETENHEIVLAEGVPAETFIDNVARQRFDNYGEFEALYGAAPEPMQELPQPRAASARQVPRAIRERIAAAAAVLAPALDEVA